MLILFDQGTPVGIRQCLPEHQIRTAWEQGWSTLLNGELLDAAEKAGFDLLLTTDKNLKYQQNISGREIAIVILSQSRWSLIRPNLALIAEVIDRAKPGTFSVVEVPVGRP